MIDDNRGHRPKKVPWKSTLCGVGERRRERCCGMATKLSVRTVGPILVVVAPLIREARCPRPVAQGRPTETRSDFRPHRDRVCRRRAKSAVRQDVTGKKTTETRASRKTRKLPGHAPPSYLTWEKEVVAPCLLPPLPPQQRQRTAPVATTHMYV